MLIFTFAPSELWSLCLFLFPSLSFSVSLFQADPLESKGSLSLLSCQASKTLSRRRSAPLPHQEGTWGLCEQSNPCVRDFIGFLHKPRNISLFLSPLLSYHRLWTTRFSPLKDLNTMEVILSESNWIQIKKKFQIHTENKTQWQR